MAWELSSTGFLMTLSSYIPDLLEEDFATFANRALAQTGLTKQDITHWCFHPGGKKILEAIQKTMSLTNNDLLTSFDVLKNYGNMSSPSVLFILKKTVSGLLYNHNRKERIFGAAFGPGLTMETFVATA
jgi:predicted naringenin-chalcone synthase